MRIVVTRPRGEAAELAGRLEELGHEVVVCPLIEIEPIGPAEVDVSNYEWVVVTSANGARELAARLRGTPERTAAIGPATAAALRERGVEPDLVPAVSIGPQTTEAARAGGVEVLAEAQTHDAAGLVAAVAGLQR